MKKGWSIFKESKAQEKNPTSEGDISVGYREITQYTIGLNEKKKVKFSYGRGYFNVEFDKGKIIVCGIDISNEVPKSNDFTLNFNDSIKINGCDVTDRVVGITADKVNRNSPSR